jgi:Raf kinase inhibitor-like YbhB/YbcL family protein
MTSRTQARARLQVSSPSFRNETPIPTRFSCDAEDVSPPLRFTSVPAEAKTLAWIMDDPDAPAGTWVHWLVWDVPATTRDIDDDADVQRLGGTEGKNGWGRIGYGGPCPPRGRHRYYFRVYALDTTLGLKTGSDRAELEKAMQGHVLGDGVLMGTYER